MVHSDSSIVAWPQTAALVSQLSKQASRNRRAVFDISRRLRVFSTADSAEEPDSLIHGGSVGNWTIEITQVVYKAAGFTVQVTPSYVHRRLLLPSYSELRFMRASSTKKHYS